MGTQFWWFYDVLTLTIAAGLLYHAAAKGFNKLIFRFVGAVLAFLAGFFGSGWLAEPTYSALFYENTISVIGTEYESPEMLPTILTQAQSLYPEETAELTEEALGETIAQVKAGGEIPSWLPEAIGAAADHALESKLSLTPDQDLQTLFAENPQLLQEIMAAEAPAEMLEQTHYRPFYLDVIRMALFLLLEAVVLIITGIIAAMIGDPEQLMHIRRCNKLLAVPAGLIQVFCVLVTFTVAVKLIVIATDDMMLLFNQATIEETKLFKLLYEMI